MCSYLLECPILVKNVKISNDEDNKKIEDDTLQLVTVVNMENIECKKKTLILSHSFFLSILKLDLLGLMLSHDP